MNAPHILITPDIEQSQTRRGEVPIYVLDCHYANAVLDAGGQPWVAPYTANPKILRQMVSQADGILLTGGAFDVDPSLFGQPPHPALGTLKPDRTAFEVGVVNLAAELAKPTLGICGGMQLMNVRRGGLLWQDLADEVPGAIVHEQEAPKAQTGHDVEVVAGTQLSAICGEGTLGVNSTHHQAVRTVGTGLIASAVAPDGIVEAIEDRALPFWLGVQWHPEAMPMERQQAIYQHFVAACR